MSEEKNQSKIHQTDQAIASMSDFLPRLWRSLYERMQEEGFDKGQAFDLLKIYIASH